MPWIDDGSGELKYKTSKLVKEELPTWDEVYNVFYKSHLNTYIPDRDKNKLDIYWKIPRQQFILSIIANQFNKMLFEDTDVAVEKEALMVYITEQVGLDIDVDTMQFVLYPSEEYPNKPNPTEEWCIYTFPDPDGNENPFITTFENRIDVSKQTDKQMELGLICRVSEKDKYEAINNTDLKLFEENNETSERWIYVDGTTFPAIIDIMITRFKRYFENGVKWKTDDTIPTPDIEEQNAD